MSSISDCPNHMLNKITSIECKALKTCLDIMKTTPNHAIFALSAELPTEFRIVLISTKELAKAFHQGLPFTKDIIKGYRCLTSYNYIFAKFKDTLTDMEKHMPFEKLNLIKCLIDPISECRLNRNNMSNADNMICTLIPHNFKVISTDSSIKREVSSFGVVD